MYKSHPIANVFPMMSQRDYEELRCDIERNGLVNPIILYEGMILDGRNRAKACDDLEVVVNYDEYTGDDPIGFVVSQNLCRRHLSESQRATIGEKIRTLKHVINRNTGPGKTGKTTQDPPIGGSDVENQNIPDISQKDAAAIMDVSERNIQRAGKLKREDPEKFEEVKQGTKTLNKALNEVKDVKQTQPTQQTQKSKVNLSKWMSKQDEAFGIFFLTLVELCKDMKRAEDKETLKAKAMECKKAITLYVKEILNE